MRMLEKNKKDMFYANKDGYRKKYQLDEEGNPKKYVDSQGNEYFLTDGDELKYSTPRHFRARVAGQLSSVQLAAWGVDLSNIRLQITCEKGLLPEVRIGTLIWKDNEIKWLEHGVPEPSSADFTVVGIRKEGLEEDRYLVKRNSSEELYGDT